MTFEEKLILDDAKDRALDRALDRAKIPKYMISEVSVKRLLNYYKKALLKHELSEQDYSDEPIKAMKQQKKRDFLENEIWALENPYK